MELELEKSIQQLSERSYSNYVETEAGQAGRRLAVPPPARNYQVQRGQQRIHEGTPRAQPYGRIVKVCEFSLEAVAEFGDDDARAVWRLAKRAARDFLRVSWINTAIVTTAKTDRPYMAVIVYGKY